ncbi:MAG TPA: hypothetical protein VN282_19445 [Pyrinomonadaceae bacterium]|nr:hypothetical protein [Pyrinomonadaceae bacterium]
MRQHARFSAFVFVAFVFAVSADFNRTLAQTPTPTPVQAGQVIISELRFRGPNGIRDEFVELYNNTDSPIVVLASDASGGWGVAASDGNITGTFCRIPNGTVIPARGHFLCVNPDPDFESGYSLGDYPSGNPTPTPTPLPSPTPAFATARGDANYTLFDDVPDGFGVALFTTQNTANQNSNTRLDAFGFLSSPALFREGNGFPTVAASSNEHTYYRDLRTGGIPRDTGDNASDFLLVGTTLSIQVTRLGAPGPENLASPVVNNATINSSLLDPNVVSSSPPNRTRNFQTEDPNTSLFGTMFIRRTITNNTGLPVSRLRFRIINITTDGTPGSECVPSPCADLRALTSSDEATVTTSQGPVSVRGLTLEENPPIQPVGGGYNASLSENDITLATPLPDKQSINVVFKLGVQRTGPFRFFINFEAQNSPAPIITAPAASGGTDLGRNSNRKKVVADTAGSAQGAAPASPAAAPSAAPVNVYAPFLIYLPPPAAEEEEEKEKEDEGKEKKSAETPPSAEPAPPQATEATPAADPPAPAADEAAPAETQRAPQKKHPAAAKAPKRGEQ